VRPVDTILVTGFLGAGKTTLVTGWLAARPGGERWAVLVNEFGALGVDRALLGGDAAGGEVAVAEVAGGCACCAAQVGFDVTLTRLLRRGPWDRLIVETTGLGHPARLVDRLRAPLLAGRIALRPPVAVVDATRAALYLDASRPGHEIARAQVELARVLVLNRAGALPAGEVAALAAALAALPPWPRTVLATADGRVAIGALSAPDAAEPASAPIRRPAAEADARSVAWWWPAGVAFDRTRLRAALDGLAAPGGPWQAHGLLRAKGVFRTEREWYGWQWADGRVDWRETAWRADSRLEVLAKSPVDPQMVDAALRTAVTAGSVADGRRM
jgi:G3E family GTPase